MLRKEFVNFRLRLVGPVPHEERDWLDQEICRNDLTGHVEVPGKVPYEEVLKANASADICLLPIPSKLELDYVYPIKIFEYMAAGKAIIASRLPGVSRVLEDGRTGLLFEPGNVTDLARGLKTLINDPALRRKPGEAARVSVKRFDWAVCDLKIETAIRGLLADRGR